MRKRRSGVGSRSRAIAEISPAIRFGRPRRSSPRSSRNTRRFACRSAPLLMKRWAPRSKRCGRNTLRSRRQPAARTIQRRADGRALARASAVGAAPGTPASAQSFRGGDMADPFNLERFVDAQAAIYDQARRELEVGRKQSHWMWFIFPQIAGLGQSAISIRFAIASLDEAKAYLAHPVLGARLSACARLVLDLEGAERARDLRRDRRDEIPLVDDPLCARGRGRRPVPALPGQIFRGPRGPADTGATLIGLLSPPGVFCWRGMRNAQAT